MSARKEGFGPIIKRAISAFTGNFYFYFRCYCFPSSMQLCLSSLLQQTGAKDLMVIKI